MDDETKSELVDHPAHYGGADNPYEHVKVMEATLSREQFIGAMIYLTSKHHTRLGKKIGMSAEVDAGKAAWYSARLASYLREHPEKNMQWFRDVGKSGIKVTEVTEEMRMEALRHVHEVPAPLGSGESITLLGVPLQSVGDERGHWYWGIDRSRDRAGPGGHRS